MPSSFSSPNSESIVSPSIIGSNSKKRKKSSWTEQHIIFITEANLSRWRCMYCNITWSTSTSTGSIARHLLDKHQIDNTSELGSSSVLHQSSADTSKLLISRSLERKFDSCIAKYYIVTEMLPHVHVDSIGFRRLVHDFLPGYCYPRPKDRDISLGPW